MEVISEMALKCWPGRYLLNFFISKYLCSCGVGLCQSYPPEWINYWLLTLDYRKVEWSVICVGHEKEEIIWLFLEKDQFYASLDIFETQISPCCVALHHSTASKHYQRGIFAIVVNSLLILSNCLSLSSFIKVPSNVTETVTTWNKSAVNWV